jgi:Kelch motif
MDRFKKFRRTAYLLKRGDGLRARSAAANWLICFTGYLDTKGHLTRNNISTPDDHLLNPCRMKGNYLIPCFAIIMLLMVNMSCVKDPPVVRPRQQNNTSPVANAGPDKFIVLPANSAELDGSASYDSTGGVLIFMWSLISGPSRSYFTQPSFKKTSVNNLSEGIYRIELIVINSANMSRRDTVNITVLKPPYCQSNRGEHPIQLDLLAILPGHVSSPELISVGNKLIVPEWWDEITGNQTNKINIYDITTQNWTVTQASKARRDVETIVAGNKIFFAGGLDYDVPIVGAYVPVSTVDIYDITTNTWTVNNLSEARGAIKATVAGTKIFFAGGVGYELSAKVNIYDLQANTWSSANLNGGARAIAAAVTSQNKSLFIGGSSQMPFEIYNNPTDFLSHPVGVIDVYDHITGQWSVLSMPSIKEQFSAIGKGDNVYISGGFSTAHPNTTFEVDILNLNTMTFSSSCLFESMVFNDKQAAVKNDQILFYGARGYKADIYNTQTGIWSIGLMPVNITPGNYSKISMTSNNNEVYAVFEDKLYKVNF